MPKPTDLPRNMQVEGQLKEAPFYHDTGAILGRSGPSTITGLDWWTDTKNHLYAFLTNTSRMRTTHMPHLDSDPATLLLSRIFPHQFLSGWELLPSLLCIN